MPYKRGFTNIFKQPFAVVNVARLEELFEAGDEITPESLVARRVVTDKVLRPPVVPFKGWQVKVLGDGEITKALTVRVHRVTASAREKIVAAGGTVEETAADRTEAAEETA
jgi:large subunit ribosomal protein L15